MVIGVDLDEVLVPTLSYQCIFLNRKYGFNLREKDFFSYEFCEVYGVTREQATKDFFEFCQTQEFRDMQPYQEALSGVASLRGLRELCIITSRQNILRDLTRRWVDRYFSSLFSNIDFGNLYSFEGRQIRKLELCKGSRIELLIEDNPMHALEVAREIPVILFPEKPWNKHLQKTNNITRANNWCEIVEKAKMILNPSSQS